MLVLLAIAWGLVVGWILGGRVRGLEQVRLRGESLFVILLVASVLIPRMAMRWLDQQWHEPLRYAWAAVMVVLVVLAVLNWRHHGAVLMGGGLLLNIVVIMLNSGMPVDSSAVRVLSRTAELPDGVSDAFHHVASPDTLLALLGDVVPVPGPSAVRAVASLGDVLLLAGLALIVLQGMLQGRQWTSAAPDG